MGLTVYLDEISQDFEIYGRRGGEWQPFVKGAEYQAFLARRRSRNDENNRGIEPVESADSESE